MTCQVSCLVYFHFLLASHVPWWLSYGKCCGQHPASSLKLSTIPHLLTIGQAFVLHESRTKMWSYSVCYFLHCPSSHSSFHLTIHPLIYPFISLFFYSSSLHQISPFTYPFILPSTLLLFPSLHLSIPIHPSFHVSITSPTSMSIIHQSPSINLSTSPPFFHPSIHLLLFLLSLHQFLYVSIHIPI